MNIYASIKKKNDNTDLLLFEDKEYELKKVPYYLHVIPKGLLKGEEMIFTQVDNDDDINIQQAGNYYLAVTHTNVDSTMFTVHQTA